MATFEFENTTPTNNPPVAVDDIVTTDEDTLLSGDVLAANPTTPDSDPDGDPLSVTEVNGNAADVGTQVTLTSGALLTLNSNGTFDYDPNGQFDSLNDGDTDTDSFTYQIGDGNGAFDTATVNISIDGITDNQPPVAVDDSFTTDEDTLLSGDVLAANPTTPDSDPDGDPLSVTEVNGNAADVGTQVTLTSGALLTLNSNGTFDYDPNGQFESLNNGDTDTDSFTYQIGDGNGAFDTATVNISIDGITDNQPPVAVDDSVTTDEDTLLSGNVLVANPTTPDSDPDGDPLTVTEVNGNAADVGTQVTLTSGALLTLNSNGTFDYDPNGQFESLNNGDTDTDSFTYQIGDGNGGTDTATVTITIDGVTPGQVINGTNQKDTLTGGAGDDTISGGNGADELFGLAGDDILGGDNGPDLLNGGPGNDTLTGGNGPDVFVLAEGEGTDTITDFSNPDSIGLSGGIGFNDLSFSGSDITLTSTSEVLATLTGVDTTTLTEADFTTV